MILRQATRQSLVILDELGRGTSTFDGNAIAYAVTKHLTTAVKARTLFATHYHTLTEDFEADPGVALGHMSCLVDEDASSAGAAGAKVTFLYTFAPGACPKSYGLNSAWTRAARAHVAAPRAGAHATHALPHSFPPLQSRRSRGCPRASSAARRRRARPSSRRAAPPRAARERGCARCERSENL